MNDNPTPEQEPEPFIDTPEGFVCKVCDASLGTGSEIELHAPTCEYRQRIERTRLSR